jgi:hypothetical protein
MIIRTRRGLRRISFSWRGEKPKDLLLNAELGAQRCCASARADVMGIWLTKI